MAVCGKHIAGGAKKEKKNIDSGVWYPVATNNAIFFLNFVGNAWGKYYLMDNNTV